MESQNSKGKRQKLRKASPEYFKVLGLRTVGNFLVLFSLFMIGKTFYQPVREEIRYFLEKRINKQYLIVGSKEIAKIKKEQIPPQPRSLLSYALNIHQVDFLVPEDPNFSIVIPKIGANAKVLANVDAGNKAVYLEALKKGVAHTEGTAFPGEGGHIFLFAHSTDYFWNVGSYNAIFYLLYKLEKGDEINLFYQGERFLYRLIDKKIVEASQVEYLTRKTNKEFLTLQTCWPPGTTLKRLLVFATRVAE